MRYFYQHDGENTYRPMSMQKFLVEFMITISSRRQRINRYSPGYVGRIVAEYLEKGGEPREPRV